MNMDETYLLRDASPLQLSDEFLQLGAFQERSLVAGPGERAVVWVAGCLRRCPGCMKPDLFAFDAGRTILVEELATRIQSIPGLTGVTFSGGEPFEQAAALGKLAKTLRDSGLSVLVYSGYRYEALVSQPARFSALLEQTDFLIDGEYRQDLPGPLLWRGSVNQVLHNLSSNPQMPRTDTRLQEVQCTIDPDSLRLSGFPDSEMTQKLSQQLAKRGIELCVVRAGNSK